jgi:hypothetical protein
MAPHGRWWDYAGDLLAIQLLGVTALVANVGPLIRRDRVLRRARAQYRAQLVELAAATPAFALLGRLDFARDRAAASVERREVRRLGAPRSKRCRRGPGFANE